MAGLRVIESLLVPIQACVSEVYRHVINALSQVEEVIPEGFFLKLRTVLLDCGQRQFYLFARALIISHTDEREELPFMGSEGVNVYAELTVNPDGFAVVIDRVRIIS